MAKGDSAVMLYISRIQVRAEFCVFTEGSMGISFKEKTNRAAVISAWMLLGPEFKNAWGEH